MKTFQVSDFTKSNSARRPSFKPILEDSLQVLKGPLNNPETKDLGKIISVMKNCYFFRENFSSQVALKEFVELAKFYVGYEVHKYGTVLLHDKEYTDKLCVVLDGTVEKISQKPYGEVEEQIKEKRRRMSCLEFELSPPSKAKIQLPSLKSPRVLGNGEPSLGSFARLSTQKAKSIHIQHKKVQRHASQRHELRLSTFGEQPPVNSSPVFEDLMKFIVNKKPEMKVRYYAEDILRADRVKTLNTGDYFGESFCVGNHLKSNFMYAVSSPEAHLLTLSKEDYYEVMRQLENLNYKKLEAFVKLFPLFEKDQIQKFSEYFAQKNFQADEVIYFQGASAQDLYIVQSGEVQLLRKRAESRERGGSSLMPIASVGKDQAFGEEFVLLMDGRQESAIASVSNTTVLVLKYDMIADLEEEFHDFFVELKKKAEEKFKCRQKKAKELFEKNENNSSSPSDYSPQHSLSPIRDRTNLFNPRHSIQIPHRRSFILEKSAIQSNSASNLPSSFASILSSESPRKYSDGESPQHAQKNKLYKSRFGRTNVISELSQITRPAGEKTSSFFQPAAVSGLKDIHFRSELYGESSRNSRNTSPDKNFQDAQKIVSTKNQTRFKILIKKRIVN